MKNEELFIFFINIFAWLFVIKNNISNAACKRVLMNEQTTTGNNHHHHHHHERSNAKNGIPYIDWIKVLPVFLLILLGVCFWCWSGNPIQSYWVSHSRSSGTWYHHWLIWQAKRRRKASTSSLNDLFMMVQFETYKEGLLPKKKSNELLTVLFSVQVLAKWQTSVNVADVAFKRRAKIW